MSLNLVMANVTCTLALRTRYPSCGESPGLSKNSSTCASSAVSHPGTGLQSGCDTMCSGFKLTRLEMRPTAQVQMVPVLL